jgi:hypothetical protein
MTMKPAPKIHRGYLAKMRESVTYQKALDEGRVEAARLIIGRQAGSHNHRKRDMR